MYATGFNADFIDKRTIVIPNTLDVYHDGPSSLIDVVKKRNGSEDYVYEGSYRGLDWSVTVHGMMENGKIIITQKITTNTSSRKHRPSIKEYEAKRSNLFDTVKMVQDELNCDLKDILRTARMG